MRLPEVSRTIQVPDDVTISIVGKTVNVKGAKGNLTRDFSYATVALEAQGKIVKSQLSGPAKKKLH
jgi:large subunit ribosomal protein L6